MACGREGEGQGGGGKKDIKKYPETSLVALATHSRCSWFGGHRLIIKSKSEKIPGDGGIL